MLIILLAIILPLTRTTLAIVRALLIRVIIKIGSWVWSILEIILKRRLAATDTNLAVPHIYIW